MLYLPESSENTNSKGLNLNDTNVYEICSQDPSQELCKSLHRLISDVEARGEFYLLPKIHKRLVYVPGQPVVSNSGYHTEAISELLDNYLQPQAQNVRSYTSDTSDFYLR